MSQLNAQVGELNAQISIKRAATGKVEHYTLTGSVTKEQFDALVKDGVLPPGATPTENHTIIKEA